MRTKNHNFRQSSIILICTMLMSSMSSAAQENDDTSNSSMAAKTFSLVYVAQDETMPIPEMERKLKTAWNRAVMEGPTIFYLSRGLDDPIIVKVNIEDDDNRADFDNVLIPSINQDISYSVDGPRDKQRILELLFMHNFLDDDGTPLYKETNFDFHVGQDFWTAGNNEVLIASLFFELDIKKHIPDNFHFNVFCPRTVTYNNDIGPFGLLNLDDCRQYVNMDRSY